MRSKKQTRRRRCQPSFQVLEARQLLAGDLAGPHQVGVNLPAGANILANGDFETVIASEDNFYDEIEVNGWQAAGENAELNIFRFDDRYGNVLDLDSTVSEFDRVFQDIDTEVLTEYLITFDFRNHPAANPDATPQSYDFEVWWNGTQQAVFTATDVWQTGTVRAFSGISDLSNLLFCEVLENGEPGGDGLGPLLDNIRVFEVAATDIVDNGSFEERSGDGIFHLSYEVEGWGAMAPEVNQRLLKIFDSGDQAQATAGNSYLNLDATDVRRDIVFQDLDTTAGATYYVTFDMRVDGSGISDNDEMRVRWNQSWAGTFLGDSDWQNYGLMLTADSSETRLTFLEPGIGDGSGPLIDNVQIFEVVQPTVAIDANGDADGTLGDARFFPGAGAINLGGDIVLTHPDGDQLTSATITLNGVVNGNHEVLAISPSLIPLDETDQPKITLTTYDPSTRQLRLEGTATLAEYQTVLRSLAYHNAAADPLPTLRSVQLEVTDSAMPAAQATGRANIQISTATSQLEIDNAIIQKFIQDNGLNAVPVQDGLFAVIDEPGTGATPNITNTVRVAYNGRFIELNEQNRLVEGESFDSSSADGVQFPLRNVIEGWQLGIPMFQEGGSGKLLIPSHLGYGPNGSFSIPGNTVLVFDVELLEVL